MSKPTRIETDNQYANWLKQITLMIAPQNAYLVLGRAAGKTTDFIAERAQDIVHDMPGALFAWAADTYLNAQKNIIPGLVQGWEDKGWKENIHFVIDRPPLPHFDNPFKRVINWKHTVTTWNGCHLKIISMDRPSTGAGDSYQHVFGDEAKYLEKKKIDKLIPAIRGEYVRFGKSVYYRGRTFATDMPNIGHSEDDWILGMAKQMDHGQIELILQTAFLINDLRIKQQSLEDDPETMASLEKQIFLWELRWKAIRKNSTFFYVASSFVNVDILTLDYFKDSLASLGWPEFRSSVLSIKSSIRKGDAFYPKLTPDHYYKDGNNYDFYDKFGLRDQLIESSNGLKWCIHDQPLSGGLDVGNSLWLIIGQDQGQYERILKNFYTLPKDYIRELADKFIEFFAPHRKKILYLYHDRSANQYKKIGRDVASEVKRSIEYDKNGQPTGWYVKLMNENQGIITHAVEYDFMMELLEELNPKLPKLQLDFYNCRELKSSLEHTPVKISERRGRKTLEKDKSSEKRYADRPELLPFMSTNFSDALKYYLCRKDYLQRSNSARQLTFSEPKIR